jgi:hypothetical protein
MRGKKGSGLLPENAFSMVVAVVAITLLVIGIIYGIYNLYTTNEEKIAKNTLNTIVDKINGFNENPVPFKVNVQGPSGMTLYGWGKDNPNRPENCFLKSCVCLCSEKCSENYPCACAGGVCRSVDADDVSVRMPDYTYVSTAPLADPLGVVPKICAFNFGIRFSENLVEIQIDDKALMRSQKSSFGGYVDDLEEANKKCNEVVDAYVAASANEKGEKNFVSLYSTGYIPR